MGAEGGVEYFVNKQSVVREIWGKSDTILLIFAGSAAEFALSKAVDWLYFTGRLPVDPIGRLFSTVAYARAIIFSEKKTALKAIDAMTAIHSIVEQKRAAKIPDWAYKDVLFMLVDYSIRSFEVLERALSNREKDEVFQVFNNVGIRMGLTGLPESFEQWEIMRQRHLDTNLQYSNYTADLFKQYHKHLRTIRYRILLESQMLVVPKKVRELLRFRKSSLIHPLIAVYKLSRNMAVGSILRTLIQPSRYRKEIMALDS